MRSPVRSLQRAVLSALTLTSLGSARADTHTPSDRKPANTNAQRVLSTRPETLTKLYEKCNLSESDLKHKVKAATDSLQLLRSFIPLYYDLSNKAQPMQSLRDFRGLTAGDAHLENFGSSVQADGSVAYTINDIDDAGSKVPVYLDYVRLMISARLSSFRKDISFSRMTQSYIVGLENIRIETPQIIKDLLAKSKSFGFAPKKKYLTERGDFVLPKIDQRQELKDSEAIGFLAAVRDMVIRNGLSKNAAGVTWLGGGSSPREAAQSAFKLKTSFDGGSGGYDRFAGAFTWPEAPGPLKIVIIEAKELRQSGSSPEDLESEIVPGQNFKKFLGWERGPQFSKLIDVVRFENKTFMLRPKFHGENSLEFDDLNSVQRNEVLQYQAWILGQMHLKTLGPRTKAYLQEINKFDVKADWNEVSEAFGDRFETLYKDYLKGIGI